MFLLSEIRPKRICQDGSGEVSVPQNNSEMNFPADIVTMGVPNETPQFIVTTNEIYGFIITVNVADGTSQVDYSMSCLNTPGNIFHFKLSQGWIKEVSTSPEWGEYLASRREKNHFPLGMREWLLECEKLNEHNLIDPTTISRDEWKRFIDIAFQRVISKDDIDKEATVIDFTEDFVYVLFLPPKPEAPFREADYLCWVQMDRKTGEVMLVLNPPG